MPRVPLRLRVSARDLPTQCNADQPSIRTMAAISRHPATKSTKKPWPFFKSPVAKCRPFRDTKMSCREFNSCLPFGLRPCPCHQSQSPITFQLCPLKQLGPLETTWPLTGNTHFITVAPLTPDTFPTPVPWAIPVIRRQHGINCAIVQSPRTYLSPATGTPHPADFCRLPRIPAFHRRRQPWKCRLRPVAFVPKPDTSLD